MTFTATDASGQKKQSLKRKLDDTQSKAKELGQDPLDVSAPQANSTRIHSGWSWENKSPISKQVQRFEKHPSNLTKSKAL